MDIRIVEKGAFHIVGLKESVSLQNQGVNSEITAMWATLAEEDIRELKQLSSEDPPGLISATVNLSDCREKGTDIDHFIGVATTRPFSDKWQELYVPASSWMVFNAVGKFPETMQDMWEKIHSEWFAISGYLMGEGPEILWNENKDTSLPDFRSEIWIPVVKK